MLGIPAGGCGARGLVMNVSKEIIAEISLAQLKLNPGVGWETILVI